MGIYISLLSVPSHLEPYAKEATTMAANAKFWEQRWMQFDTELKVNRMCKDITKEAQSFLRKNPGGSWSLQVYALQ